MFVAISWPDAIQGGAGASDWGHVRVYYCRWRGNHVSCFYVASMNKQAFSLTCCLVLGRFLSDFLFSYFFQKIPCGKDDYVRGKVLGEGAFGRVYQITLKNESKSHLHIAMKVLKCPHFSSLTSGN